RAYNVFNADQVDGYNLPSIPLLSETERIGQAEAFFAATGATIRHGGNRAYYNIDGDFIQLPDFGQFRDAISYYAILAHETCHWVGSPSRCNRDLSGRFGSMAYAAEELVAEIGAAFLCAELGLANEPRQDHAAYINSWIQILQNDKRAIFTA